MKAYPIYELTQVESLRHLIDLRAEDNPNGIAFFYTGDDGSVKTVSYSRFRDDVAACATYFMSQGYREGAHIAADGGFSAGYGRGPAALDCQPAEMPIPPHEPERIRGSNAGGRRAGVLSEA